MVHHIIGQQISTKAQQTIWLRMNEKYGHVTPEVIDSADAAELQSLGMTFRKAEYIKDFSHKVVSGEFSLDAVWQQYGICLIKRLLRRCHLSTALVYGLPK